MENEPEPTQGPTSTDPKPNMDKKEEAVKRPLRSNSTNRKQTPKSNTKTAGKKGKAQKTESTDQGPDNEIDEAAYNITENEASDEEEIKTGANNPNPKIKLKIKITKGNTQETRDQASEYITVEEIDKIAENETSSDELNITVVSKPQTQTYEAETKEKGNKRNTNNELEKSDDENKENQNNSIKPENQPKKTTTINIKDEKQIIKAVDSLEHDLKQYEQQSDEDKRKINHLLKINKDQQEEIENLKSIVHEQDQEISTLKNRMKQRDENNENRSEIIVQELEKQEETCNFLRSKVDLLTHKTETDKATIQKLEDQIKKKEKKKQTQTGAHNPYNHKP